MSTMYDVRAGAAQFRVQVGQRRGGGAPTPGIQLLDVVQDAGANEKRGQVCSAIRFYFYFTPTLIIILIFWKEEC